ncbi:orotidine-5'-phosphate decarboxylase [Nanoarchaeota archaeon]
MSKSYLNQLKTQTEKTGSIVCMGIDPVAEKIPIKGSPGVKIVRFYLDILETMQAERVFPAIVKPNIAFFEQYDFEGFIALKKIMSEYRKAKIPIILDAKRGDIGKTSTAYAESIFNGWKADATTINPYMGSDSVMPFIEYCKEGKGAYVLVRTSNKGAKDFEDLKVKKDPVYMKVAKKLINWHKPGVGAVVGATSPRELAKISEFFVKSKKKIPLLIPGVGAQGGSAKEVIKALKKTNNPVYLHRINSSSGINYAYLKAKNNQSDYAGAAVKALKELNKEINI